MPDEKTLGFVHNAFITVSEAKQSGKEILDRGCVDRGLEALNISLHVQRQWEQAEARWKKGKRVVGGCGWRGKMRLDWGSLWNQDFINFNMQTNHLSNLVKMQLLIQLMGSPFCISNKIPGGVMLLDVGQHLNSKPLHNTKDFSFLPSSCYHSHDNEDKSF